MLVCFFAFGSYCGKEDVPETVNGDALHIFRGEIELESAFEILNLPLDIAPVER